MAFAEVCAKVKKDLPLNMQEYWEMFSLLEKKSGVQISFKEGHQILVSNSIKVIQECEEIICDYIRESDARKNYQNENQTCCLEQSGDPSVHTVSPNKHTASGSPSYHLHDDLSGREMFVDNNESLEVCEKKSNEVLQKALLLSIINKQDDKQGEGQINDLGLSCTENKLGGKSNPQEEKPFGKVISFKKENEIESQSSDEDNEVRQTQEVTLFPTGSGSSLPPNTLKEELSPVSPPTVSSEKLQETRETAGVEFSVVTADGLADKKSESSLDNPAMAKEDSSFFTGAASSHSPDKTELAAVGTDDAGAAMTEHETGRRSGPPGSLHTHAEAAAESGYDGENSKDKELQDGAEVTLTVDGTIWTFILKVYKNKLDRFCRRHKVALKKTVIPETDILTVSLVPVSSEAETSQAKNEITTLVEEVMMSCYIEYYQNVPQISKRVRKEAIETVNFMYSSILAMNDPGDANCIMFVGEERKAREAKEEFRKLAGINSERRPKGRSRRQGREVSPDWTSASFTGSYPSAHGRNNGSSDEERDNFHDDLFPSKSRSSKQALMSRSLVYDSTAHTSHPDDEKPLSQMPEQMFQKFGASKMAEPRNDSRFGVPDESRDTKQKLPGRSTHEESTKSKDLVMQHKKTLDEFTSVLNDFEKDTIDGHLLKTSMDDQLQVDKQGLKLPNSSKDDKGSDQSKKVLPIETKENSWGWPLPVSGGKSFQDKSSASTNVGSLISGDDKMTDGNTTPAIKKMTLNNLIELGDKTGDMDVGETRKSNENLDASPTSGESHSVLTDQDLKIFPKELTTSSPLSLSQQLKLELASSDNSEPNSITSQTAPQSNETAATEILPNQSSVEKEQETMDAHAEEHVPNSGPGMEEGVRKTENVQDGTAV